MSIKPSKIRCYVAGDDPLKDCFKVAIEDLAETHVDDWKEIVAHRIKTDVPSRKFRIYKVHVEKKDAPRVLDFLPITDLDSFELLSTYWTHNELLSGHIHAVVVLPSSEPPEVPAQRKDEVERMTELLDAAQLVYITKQRERSSSGWAHDSQFRELQATVGCIKNGRPAHQVGLPIGFYHPVFDNFLRNLESRDRLPVSSCILTRKLFAASQKDYASESERDSAIKVSLGLLVGESSPETIAKSACPDGMITGRGGTCCVLMELKNEIGTGGSDPSIQAALSYSKYWGAGGREDVRIQCCCPSLLIAIAGPCMCILGAVLLNQAVVQPLTDFIWLGDNPQRDSHLDYVARVFRCVSLAREELQTYYNNLPGTGKQLGRFFPRITHYPDSLDCQIHFSYISKLAPGGSSKAIFKARTRDTDQPKDIVVKFVRSYNSEAHKLLAARGLAPELLYDGSASAQIRPGFWMIVMEFVAGVDLLHPTQRVIPEMCEGGRCGGVGNPTREPFRVWRSTPS